MKSGSWLTLILTIACIVLFIYRTQSYYSDTAVSSSSVFSVAAEFPQTSPTPSPFPTILINEISSAGTSSGEWVELYNPNLSDINISGWKIADNSSDDLIPDISPIPGQGYSVIVTSNTVVSGIPPSAITIILSSGAIGTGLNNDGDAVFLKNPSDAVIDQMSYGNSTAVFPTPPPYPLLGGSLSRIPNGTDTNTAADWLIDSSPTVGTANSL